MHKYYNKVQITKIMKYNYSGTQIMKQSCFSGFSVLINGPANRDKAPSSEKQVLTVYLFMSRTNTHFT